MVRKWEKENIEEAAKKENIIEIICDADSKTILIYNMELEKVGKIFQEISYNLTNVAKTIASAFCETWSRTKEIVESILPIIERKKLTKNKFKKLLQSQGLQRNQINQIIKNNNEPYTYKRYIDTLNNFKRWNGG